MPLVAPVLIGVIAALALLATYEFTQAVHDTLSKVPYIGKYIANLVAAALASILVYLQGVWAMAARTLNATFVKPVSMFLQLTDALGSLATQAATSTFWVANNLVQHVWDRLVDRIASALEAAKRYALAEVHRLGVDLRRAIHSARTYAHGLVATLHHTLALAIHDARTYADHLFREATGGVRSAIHTAEAYAASLVHTLRVDLTKSITSVENTVKADLSKAIGYTDTQVGRAVSAAEAAAVTAAGAAVGSVEHQVNAALSAVWPGLIGAVDDLEVTIGTDLADIGAAVRAIPRAVPTDLAAAIPAILSVAIPAIRYMDRCGVPNCRNLSAIGREIQGLIKLAEGGAFLAALVELVHDPIGVATEVHDVLGTIVEDTASGARHLLGV